MRESVRYFVELSKLGLPIKYVDVGGGLGVDYEGTRSRSECSVNYGLDQYAATIVQPLADVCAEHGLTPPHVITETGRAMTAHHAVLVTNVSDIEQAPLGAIPPEDADEPSALRHLREIHADIAQRPVIELYHEAQHHLAEGYALYALGQLSLQYRARLDDLYYAIVNALRGRLKPEGRAHRQALDELNEKLVDKYFVNFSIFESIPDSWAIDQIFPIMPIAGLEHKPDRRGVIADLTCDSDGRIDQYVAADGVDVSLPLHFSGRRVPGSARRYPQSVRRYRRRQRALECQRRFRVLASASRRYDGSHARLRRLRSRRTTQHVPRQTRAGRHRAG